MFYTFYSFKGGVGRSMAVANVAELLYRRGLKVLAIDFDLEAPGLERFFWENVPGSIMEHRGVIDLAQSFKALQSLPPTPNLVNPSVLTKFNFRVEPLSNFIIPVHEEDPAGGALYLIPAGRRPENDYAQFSERVRSFDWDDFYSNWKGQEFFDWFKEEAKTIADAILVDSRTGITEIGGICTHHLADVVVTLITTNMQNLEGSMLIAESLRKRGEALKESDVRPKEVLIVPSRIELSESPSLASFKKLFNQKVECFKPEKLKFAQNQFDDLSIPYVPRYSYFEKLAVTEPQQPVAVPLIAAFERLVTAMVELAPKHSRFYRIYYSQTGTFSILGPQARTLELPEPLVGREWVFDALDSWLEESGPRVFLIIGDPGSGKTALATNLIQISQGEIEGVEYQHIGMGALAYAHFCHPADVRSLNPLDFVRSLALVLANRYPQFAQALAQVRERGISIEIHQSISSGSSSSSGSSGGSGGSGLPGGLMQRIQIAEIEFDLGGLGQSGSEVKTDGKIPSERQEIGHLVRRAFANLILDPLEKMSSRGSLEPIVILIDQIEASLTYDLIDNLVNLGALALRQLPPQVRFIFTSRRDPRVLTAFNEATTLDLNADSPSIVGDIFNYAAERLRGVDEDQRPQVIKQVVELSAGNFIYARFLLDGLSAKEIKIDQLKAGFLPRKVESLYHQYLQREIGSDSTRWEEKDSAVLGLLCVSYGEGLTPAQLSAILVKPASEINNTLQPWMKYLKGAFPDGPFQPYHLSFRTYLLLNSEYPIRIADSHRAIADYFLNEYAGEWQRCNEPYALRYTVKHLLKAVESTTARGARQELENKLNTLLTDADFLRAKAYHSGPGLADLAEDLKAAPGSASILNNLGLAYYYLGDIKKAIETYEQALELALKSGDQSLEGVNHVNLGVAYLTLGELEPAFKHNKKALEITRETGDRRGEGNALGNLGLAFANSGEPRRAIEYYEQALAIAREVGDRRSESIFLGNLGGAFHSMGELQKAIEYYEIDLAITREIGDRRGELNALSDLGLAYADTGGARRAIEYCEKALAIAREIHDRSGEGNALGNLGLAYADLGQTHKAIEFYTQAIEIIHKIGDPRGLGKFLGKLGSAYHDLRDLRQAIKYYQEALEIARKISDRRREGNLLGSLGLVYADIGDPNRARELYQESLTILEEINDQPGIAQTENNLGLVLKDSGDLAGARAKFERALAIDQKAYGDEHPSVAIRLNNLGSVYQALGDFKSAKAAFERTIEIDRKVYGDEHPKMAVHLNNLGSIYQALGNYGDAHAAYENARELVEKAYGADHPNVATFENNLGSVYQAVGEFSAASASYERALSIDEKAFGNSHPCVARDANNLGGVLLAMKKYSEARAAYERALKINQDTYGADHPNVARAYNNLGLALRAMGDYVAAQAAFEQALLIFKGKGDQRGVEAVMSNLEKTRMRLSRDLTDAGNLIGIDQTILVGDVRTSAGDAKERGATKIAQQSLGKSEIEKLLQPVEESLNDLQGVHRTVALKKVGELKAELAKGAMSDDTTVAKLIDSLSTLTPYAATALSLIITKSSTIAVLVGPVTKYVLDKIRERGQQKDATEKQ